MALISLELKGKKYRKIRERERTIASNKSMQAATPRQHDPGAPQISLPAAYWKARTRTRPSGDISQASESEQKERTDKQNYEMSMQLDSFKKTENQKEEMKENSISAENETRGKWMSIPPHTECVNMIKCIWRLPRHMPTSV
jgi:type IV secretory pathway VirB10-like protein